MYVLCVCTHQYLFVYVCVCMYACIIPVHIYHIIVWGLVCAGSADLKKKKGLAAGG